MAKDPHRFFKIEAKDLLEKISQDLLELENNTHDEEIINRLFRYAHTLKGSSRLVKLDQIGEVSHSLEDILGMAKKNEITINSGHIDLFLKAFDVVAEVLKKLNAGEDPTIDIQDIMIALKQRKEAACRPLPDTTTKQTATTENPSSTSNETAPTLTRQPEPTSTIPDDQQPVPDIEQEIIPEPQNLPINQSAEDTIRVSLQKLNTMMNLSGELVINKIKLQDKNDQLQALKTLVNINESLIENWRLIKQFPELKNSKKNHFIKEAFDNIENGFKVQLEIKNKINELSDQFEDEIQLTHLISLQLQEEAFKARMLPVKTIFNDMKRLVRDLSKDLEKSTKLIIDGENQEIDKLILDEIKPTFIHLIRNAIDHGIESPEERTRNGKPASAEINISVKHTSGDLTFTIEDNGRGLNTEKIIATALKQKLRSKQQLQELSANAINYLILEPGFSTSEIISNVSGRGIGMDVVSDTIKRLRGNLTIESELNQFTRFMIKLPQSLSNMLCLFCLCSHEKYLIPISSVSTTLRILPEEISFESNREVIQALDRTIPLVKLNRILKLADNKTSLADASKMSILVMHQRGEHIAFLVDQFLGVKEVVVKHLGNHIKKVPNVAGATIMGDGEIVVILDPADIVQEARGAKSQNILVTEKEDENEENAIKLLLVDDSLTTRMMEKSILESAGYNVDLAVSGEDALEKVQQLQYTLVITDVEMPGINGFQLTKQLKSMPEYEDIPIIIVSSLATNEMKRQGIDAGAEAYIVKAEFDQLVLLEIIESLI